MYISELTIKNYRNFKNFTISLKPFTLIIGENNIGKTNLLSAIGLVFSQDITFFKRRMLEIDDINYDAVQAFKKSVSEWNGTDKLEFPEVSVEVILSGFDTNEDHKAIVSDWFIDLELEQARLTYRFGYRGNINKFAEINKGKTLADIDIPIDECDYKIFGGLDQTKQVDYYFLKMLKMELLDALRDAQKELVANSETKLLYRILNHRDKEKYKSIKEQLIELDKQVESNDELQIVKLEIGSVLSKLSLEQSKNQNKVDFRFTSLEHTEILKKLAIEYGENPISVHRNGLGRNNLLFISLLLSHLTSEAVKQSNVLFRIIGLEEPEAHLHPQLQEHLAANIEKQSTEEMQILLTSHSTHITSKLDLENTVVLFNDVNNKLCAHYILDGFEGISKKGTLVNDKESNAHKRYLSRYFDATKSTLLFARKIILVEGISEQILIPRLFELYNEGKTLENIGCTVINVNGVAFSHFLELVRNKRTDKEKYFIRTLVFTDSDSKKKTNLRAEELKREYDSADSILIQISESETFEKDIINSNKSKQGKCLMFKALCQTRPNNGKKLKDNYQTNDINIDEFFNEIEEYKADFATDLLSILEDEQDLANFTIPEYIKLGFEFLLNSSKVEVNEEAN